MQLRTSLMKMALLSKPASWIFIAALCLIFVMQLHPSDCSVGTGCFRVHAAPHAGLNRKLLGGGEGYKGVGSGGKGVNVNVGAGWELREAPLGPDPLHHHGDSPKKPKTP